MDRDLEPWRVAVGIAPQIRHEFREIDPLPVVYFLWVWARIAVELAAEDVIELVLRQTAPGIGGAIEEGENLFQFRVETELLLESPVNGVL